MEHDHSPEAIRERLSAGPGHSYLRDFVYGGIDGAVTTFAVVSGVVGAQLAPGIILVMGAANLIADGFSMAASNYLGTRAEHEDFEHIEAIEHRHIETDPEGEREEVRQIFADKGFQGEDLTRVVELITSNRKIWVRTMLTDEYGLPHQVRSPWIAALSTFISFLVCGLVPLVPFIVSVSKAFPCCTDRCGLLYNRIGEEHVVDESLVEIRPRYSRGGRNRRGTRLPCGRVVKGIRRGVGRRQERRASCFLPPAYSTTCYLLLTTYYLLLTTTVTLLISSVVPVERW